MTKPDAKYRAGTLVALDPGLRVSGVSVFMDGKLVRAFLVRNPYKKEREADAWKGMAEAVQERLENDDLDLVYANGLVNYFISERPQVYRTAQSKADPDDLIQLAGVVGAVAVAVNARETTSFRPREWKGTMNPEAMLRLIEKKLDEDERGCIEECAASLRHNIIDSVGCGLYVLGRLR